MSSNSRALSMANALSDDTINHGEEMLVRPDLVALIDKILARYSSDFVVFRELIQNSDDAQATSFQLQFICDPASDLTNHHRKTTRLFGNIGDFFRRRLRNAKDNSSDDDDDDDSTNKAEHKFHNKIITEIRTVNDGLVFTEKDWVRVATIAQGNPNTDAVGQFGVGFFTVFSYSNRPMIKSGKHCMVFVWKADRSLTTYRNKLPEEEQSPTTSVILMMRDKYILDTKSTNHLENEQPTSPSIKSVKGNVIPSINLTQLKLFFLKVLSFTKHINKLTITIDGETVFRVKKTHKPLSSAQSTLAFKKSPSTNTSRTEMFHFNSLVHAEQIYDIAHGPSVTLNYIDVEVAVNIEKELHEQIRKILYKNLPSTIHIKLLFPSKNFLQHFQSCPSTDHNSHAQILNSLIPVRFQNNQITPCGQIFIGLATHQSTGLGIHVHSAFIPTVERENIDQQNPYVRQWNEEILLSIGKITRLIFDQMIVDQTEDYHSILSTYSFLPTTPNEKIGVLLLEGFLSSPQHLLVPVKQTPSSTQLSLLPSAQAFLSNSELICSFLSKPLVPFDLGKNVFFTVLRNYELINIIDDSHIIEDIQQSIFLLNEFVAFIQWLCSREIHDRSYVQQSLSMIRFRDSIHSPVIILNNLRFYDEFKVPADLPLPSNILPAKISSHFSPEQLQRKLFLEQAPLADLLKFYIDHKEQQKLFCERKTSTDLLVFISQHWNQCNDLRQNEIKNILSQLMCMPTTKGMKLPKDSYIDSSDLTHKKDLPVITLEVSKVVDDHTDNSDDHTTSNEHFVSAEFLKVVGCRTVYIRIDSRLDSTNAEYNREYIQKILQRRKDMSRADLYALQENAILFGTTNGKSGKYLPRDLHFPSVAEKLDWLTLLILDWPVLEPYSQEYIFLKELGVREVPELSKLINRIVQEHQQSTMIMKEYELPMALSYLVSHFHQHYMKFGSVEQSQQAFLPCYYSTKMFSQDSDTTESKVFLSAPNKVFTDEGPLFPTPIPTVVKLFQSQLDISLIGVKQRPTLDIAFEILNRSKHDILTVQTAATLFTYLNTLDGLNRNVIDSISKYAFIPLQDRNKFVTPSDVFIHSNHSTDQASMSFIDGNNTNGLIDYIDYGSTANSFLEAIGVLYYPPAEILAKLVLDRQEEYFSDSNNYNTNTVQIKLNVYTACLKQLAVYSTCKNQLNVDPLRSRLINEPWCLGYQMSAKDDTDTARISKIVKPKEIYLNDDEQYLNVLRPLCAPDERELVKLYEQYGAKWLSECVQRTLLPIGKESETEQSKSLLALIQRRLCFLFRNKRGEYMTGVNEERIQMLGKSLSVYETDDIQCQLKFKNKTTPLSAAQCSSCVLNVQNTAVKLFIKKDISNFEYFDIATELARFIFKKPKEDTVDTISNRLSSSLDVLRRRGIPVDRFISALDELPESTLHQPNKEQKTKTRSGEYSVQRSDNFHSVQKSELKNTPAAVPNFKGDEHDNRKISYTKNVKPYLERNLTDSGDVRRIVLSRCQPPSALRLIRSDQLFYSIPLFYEANVRITKEMLDQADQLACVLSGLATHVFHIPVNSMHLFRDINGDKIAFNIDGSLFFNLRYFEQIFSEKIDPYASIASDSVVIKLIDFYFILTCHELTHNRHLEHDLNFINNMEANIVEFLPEKETFLKQFSFSVYF